MKTTLIMDGVFSAPSQKGYSTFTATDGGFFNLRIDSTIPVDKKVNASFAVRLQNVIVFNNPQIVYQPVEVLAAKPL